MTTLAHSTFPRTRVNRRDTVSAWLVILVTALALMAGYLLRTSVESRTASYAAPAGVTLNYPDSWVVDTAPADVIARVRDFSAMGRPTTVELRVQPIDATADEQMAMAAVANDLALTRARDLQTFKLFGIRDDQQAGDRPGVRSRYVYVEAARDQFGEGVPVVVLGEDYLLHKGDQVFIFSLHAAEDNYQQASRNFDRLIQTTTLP